MVIENRNPQKKKKPLPRAVLAPLYGMHQMRAAKRTSERRPALRHESAEDMEKSSAICRAMVECHTSQDLLQCFLQHTASIPESAQLYPRYYGTILEQAIRQASLTLQDPYLALALFEQVKNRNIYSYVSGCTVKAYNAILAMRWQIWQDIHGMMTTVEEMNINGVGFDDETRAIVHTAVSEVESEMVLTGDKEHDGFTWSVDERRSANIMRELVGKWIFK
ncbi:hypothetical protein BCR43DRAFT_495705 [Syncephalastrum racemosum]|uniref:Mtf2-like C-terminal domain-containing protein n=1 Tax=Syncephalastrum racemosum TaxID=13706 RepID=A0A1X2H6C6_SYNRA|nr:hypothetical protein BCR43DRAFT_495705 [Syncephalastrum racemosum]